MPVSGPPRWPMLERALNFRPPNSRLGDVIPFFHDGTYHLFYLQPNAECDSTSWHHLATQDFLSFRDYGISLTHGGLHDQDLHAFTGSVIYAFGRFHMFYTAHNRRLSAAGGVDEAIMRAVSDDLQVWEKVPDEVLYAFTPTYDPNNWRDPFVYWDDRAGEYRMLLAARLTARPPRRSGCTAVCVSRDLVHWELREPLFAPNLYSIHECPDLFRIGDWWYHAFSEFSDETVTRYRMARTHTGPWLAPTVDTFDGRAFYTAKSASDGVRRYIFGWNPTREGASDTGAWQWGGNLVVHELAQKANGELEVRFPSELGTLFRSHERSPFTGDFVRITSLNGHRALSGGTLPEVSRVSFQFQFAPGTRAFGVGLRASADVESGYYVRVEPRRMRLVFDRWPRPGDIPHAVEFERPAYLLPDTLYTLTLYVNGTVGVVYLCDADTVNCTNVRSLRGGVGAFCNRG